MLYVARFVACCTYLAHSLGIDG